MKELNKLVSCQLGHVMRTLDINTHNLSFAYFKLNKSQRFSSDISLENLPIFKINIKDIKLSRRIIILMRSFKE
jgi:hypothetical protein